MTNEERNSVLEEAAKCVENLGEPHYFQFAARMVRELKREEKPIKCGLNVFVLSPSLSGEHENVLALPEQFDCIVRSVSEWIKKANPGESVQIECTTITRKEFKALREI